MNGVHDLGGMQGFGPVEREENEPAFHADWEAVVLAIQHAGRQGLLFNIDEFRHGIERMAPAHYLRATYYEKWLEGITRVLIEKGVLDPQELIARRAFFERQPDAPAAAALPGPPPSRGPLPAGVDARTSSATPGPPRVSRRARPSSRGSMHPQGHTRLPRYARGKRGVIHCCHGIHVFPDTQRPRPGRGAAAALQRALRRARAVGRVGGAEPGRPHRSLGELSPAREVSRMGKNHPNVDPYIVSRVRALESLLLEKGILAPDAVDRVIQRYEADTGPMVGARAVAKAWTDPDYRRLLLDDPKAALGQLDLDYEMLMVVENTEAVHNLVVCTLCSCYPWPVLGLPPTWYKMPAYRSRAVSEPRTILREMGLAVPAEREIRVWDSSAEMRYMVLPIRPAGTEGLGEAELVPLITRDALIGVAEPRATVS